MSEVLELASSMQKRSEKLVSSTTQSVENALKRHEKSISKELISSEKHLKSSIQKKNQGLLQSHQESLNELKNSQRKIAKAMGLYLLIPTVSLLIVILGLWGTMYFLASQTKENISMWSRSKENLENIPSVRDYGELDGKKYIVLRNGKYKLVPQKNGTVVLWEE